MSGHEKRKQLKMGHIIKATMELCNKYGTQKVTIDEIADHAKVSKVTLYKYFDSKENLIATLINRIYADVINKTATLIDGEGDFLEQLNTIMQSKINSFTIFNGDFFKELFVHSSTDEFAKFNTSIKQLMFKFFDKGKDQGYIDTKIDNNTLYIYSEIFNAGFQSSLSNNLGLIADKEQMGQLIQLYFYGLIKPN